MEKKLIKHEKLYKEGKKTFSKLLRKTKNTNWQKYCNEIEKLKDTARLAKVLDSKNTAIGALIKGDGSYTSSPEETLNHLADSLLGKTKVKKKANPVK